MTSGHCSTCVVCNKKPDPKTAPVARRPRVFLSRHALTLATWLLSPPHLPPLLRLLSLVLLLLVLFLLLLLLLEAALTSSNLSLALAVTLVAATLHLNSGTNLQLIYVNRQQVWVSNQRAAGSAAPAAAELPCCCSSASSGVVHCAVIRPRLQKCNSFSCSKTFRYEWSCPRAVRRKSKNQTRQTRNRRCSRRRRRQRMLVLLLLLSCCASFIKRFRYFLWARWVSGVRSWTAILSIFMPKIDQRRRHRRRRRRSRWRCRCIVTSERGSSRPSYMAELCLTAVGQYSNAIYVIVAAFMHTWRQPGHDCGFSFSC